LKSARDALHINTASSCIEYAVARIVHRPDQPGFKELSDQIGYSQKHFIDLFKKQVGVSPKQYFRIIRFQKVIQEIEANPAIQWSHIAAESGFYDQAHFINEFKSFSGFTPNEYMERKTPVLNYVPVG